MPTVRLGLLTLPLAGLLLTWATVASSAFYNFSGAAVVGPKEVARASTSLGYFLSQFVGYILGLTLLTVGVLALTVYLSEFRRERWTLVAMVLSILGIGLLLSYYGLRTYALPVLGKAYLDGVQNAVVLANTILLDGLTRSVLYVAFLLYSAGFILFGFGVWGSGALPKWAGALLALHAPLLTAPLPDLFSVLGALLLVTGGWITFTVLRRPPSREAGGGPEPRESEPRARAQTRLRRTGTE